MLGESCPMCHTPIAAVTARSYADYMSANEDEEALGDS